MESTTPVYLVIYGCCSKLFLYLFSYTWTCCNHKLRGVCTWPDFRAYTHIWLTSCLSFMSHTWWNVAGSRFLSPKLSVLIWDPSPSPTPISTRCSLTWHLSCNEGVLSSTSQHKLKDKNGVEQSKPNSSVSVYLVSQCFWVGVSQSRLGYQSVC